MKDRDRLSNRIHEITGWKPSSRFQVYRDTSDPMRLVRGNVVRLDGRDYVVNNYMREPRFGLDDQLKYWVISSYDLETGEKKILKTIFKEEFFVHIGFLKIHCYRSPEKESDVLRITRGDHRFMQGVTCYDEKDNNVRIIDFIKGTSLFVQILNNEKKHEIYFREELGGYLWKLKDMLEAIQLLHKNDLCHGDIRNDHIFIDSKTRKFRWIDFDLRQNVSDFDLWSLGNVINFVVGKGIVTFKKVLGNQLLDEKVRRSLKPEDGSAFYEYRLMNLKKIYPYIPERLSAILKHFTVKPLAFYTSIDSLVSDYNEMLVHDFPGDEP